MTNQNSGQNGGQQPPARILVVEDDDNLRLGVCDNLEDEGYDVVSTRTAAKANEYMSRYPFDLVVLDIMLPDSDGFALCRQWRQHGVDAMILMLTARDQEDDMIQGFGAGADDYIVKPYQLRVFLSRVAALLRRYSKTIVSAGEQTGMLPGFAINTDARTVTDDSGNNVDLTKIEYDLLLFMLNNKNCALTYDDILAAVWGSSIHVVQGAIRNTVSSIRRKLNAANQNDWRIVTLRGIGYRFELDE